MFQMNGIPNDALAQVLADLAFDGSRLVSKFLGSDGTWTIIVQTAAGAPTDGLRPLEPPSEDEGEEPLADTADPGSNGRMPPVDDAVAADPLDNIGNGLVLTEADLIALWRRSLYPIRKSHPVVFGIRGCLPVDYSGTATAQSHEITIVPVNYRTMNCTLGIWKPGEGFSLYPGSTVPYGPWVTSGIPQNGAGVNQMGRGRYGPYVPGWHKRSEGRAGHWALLQEGPVTLQRTGDDDDFDLDDRWDPTYRPGDNIHCAFHMGPDGAIPSSKFSSLGCQVVAGTVKKGVPGSEAGPWKKFIAAFQGAAAPAGVDYVLFDGVEVQQMIKSRMDGKTVILRFGSYGPLVDTLQKQLSMALNRTIDTDSDFGTETFSAVIAYQTRVFGANADDGIIGAESAQKLGFTLPQFDYANAIGGGSGQVAEAPEPAINDANAGETPPITEDQFHRFASPPSAAAKRAIYDGYIGAFTSPEGIALLTEYGITANARRLAHFFGQAHHETGGFRIVRESMTYTTVEAVRSAWSTRASSHSDQWIKDNLLRNPEGIAEWAYGDRMGNVPGSGDGFKFRGGGTFQLTGRDAYRAASQLFTGDQAVNLEEHPERIEYPMTSLFAACAEWKKLGCNALADADQGKKISRGINRGNTSSTSPANGESERLELIETLRTILMA